jgi:hypothetical protein
MSRKWGDLHRKSGLIKVKCEVGNLGESLRKAPLYYKKERQSFYHFPATPPVSSNDLQESPRYPGGLALRFARVKRFREDKPASEADTIQTARAFFEATVGRQASPRG